MVGSFWRSRIETDSVAAWQARALVVAHGTNSLSYMATWPGNHYWFTPDQRSLVAYRVVATVALTVGDPIGPVDQRQAAVHGFADYCQANGWTPCLYSVTEPTAGLAREFGWKSLHIAEDAVLPLGDLRFTGRKWQDIRTALNRAAKSGMTALWITYPTAGRGITSQIDAISAQWITDKQMPEMGFTLGGVRELDDPQVRCLLAVDSHDRVVAVTSWLPIHDDGRITGWTLDFMRRTPDASPGVMEFLIATATQEFQAQGAALLSLSGAPLARMTPDGRSPALHKVLDILAASLEPAYGFRSLLAFKAKFQPTYKPLYLTYPGTADLPTIANAISRAYLPHITPHEGFQLARRLITRPRRQNRPSSTSLHAALRATCGVLGCDRPGTYGAAPREGQNRHFRWGKAPPGPGMVNDARSELPSRQPTVTGGSDLRRARCTVSLIQVVGQVFLGYGVVRVPVSHRLSQRSDHVNTWKVHLGRFADVKTHEELLNVRTRCGFNPRADQTTPAARCPWIPRPPRPSSGTTNAFHRPAWNSLSNHRSRRTRRLLNNPVVPG